MKSSPTATESAHGTVTCLLKAWEAGDAEALHRLMLYTYDELKKIAGKLLRERQSREWSPTELVNEAFVSLIDRKEAVWSNRKHFYNCAGTIMRHAIVDRLRGDQSRKRGGDRVKVSLEKAHLGQTHLQVDPETVLSVHDAMEDLTAADPALAALVTLRYFLGCSIKETSEVMEISEATVKRKWDRARRWFFKRMAKV